ncbi:tetratricopeptide-like helical domain [Fusarium longipes]|uniref:Tetratricopeptide-like helical domain n=1 Tax=Fusarium longipes TaxID=694270 RepID=A0A395T520_9HYPO|nr:tetratricopeptide-like helical domain [Fusarium longipes]
MNHFKRIFGPPKDSVQPESSITSGPAPKHPQGLNVLSDGVEPVVDIVAVHGLNGHREKTWTSDNGVYWLRDFLPTDVPNARIFSWGYDANTHAVSGTSSMFLYDHARSLVADLTRRRKLTNALIHSDAARQGALLEHRSIKISTYGIIFMGTPHQGGNGVQLGRIVANVASVFVPTDDRLFKHLERDSEWLLQQLGQYSPISGEFVTKFAYEEYPTSVAGKSILVVPKASAVVPGHVDAEPIAIHADHKNMVKFLSKEDVGYVTVSEHVQIMMSDAEGIISSRWEAESRIDKARENNKSFSILFSLSDVNEVLRFVGRQEELTQMQEILTISHSRTTLVIHGLGGMGKTQLVIEFAKRNHACYSAVLWMNATDEDTMKKSFLKVAEQILCEHPSIPNLERAVSSQDTEATIKAVKTWLNERDNNRWLIIYDNYDHPRLSGTAHIDEESEATNAKSILPNNGTSINAFDIRPFFPDTHHGVIIVTTRSSTVKLGHTIRLSKFKKIDDGVQILESTSNRKDLGKDPASIQLAEKLDGLPLALSTAGAYLDQVSMTCKEYLELYQESWYRLQKSSPQVQSYEDRAMYSTWNISYLNVERQNKSSAMLLKLWAYFDHNDLWHDLLCSIDSSPWLQALTDKITFTQSMRLLCDHGLVDAHHSRMEDEQYYQGYSVHGCVHAWIITVLNEQIDLVMALYAVMCVLSLIVARKDERERWRVEQRLLRHVDRCLEFEAESKQIQFPSPRILPIFGRFYIRQYQFGKAKVVLERALEANGRDLGWEHEYTLGTIVNLANVHALQRNLDEAEAMLDRALHGYRKTRGPEHSSTLRTIRFLGLLYMERHQLDKAKDMYEQAFRGYEKKLGLNDPLTLGALTDLWKLHIAQGTQGNLDEAKALLNRLIQVWEKIPDSVYLSIFTSLEDQALLLYKQDQLDKAQDIIQAAFRGQERIVGLDHPEIFRSLRILGGIRCHQGQLDEGKAMLKQALSGYEKHFGPKHEFTSNTVAAIGDVHLGLGELETAKDMYLRALQGYQNPSESSPFESNELANVLDRLGVLYERQRKPKLARQYYLRAQDCFREMFGDDDWRVKKISKELERISD